MNVPTTIVASPLDRPARFLPARIAMLSLALVAISGCVTHRTEIVLRVDTDMPQDATGLTAILVQVYPQEGGAALYQHRFDLNVPTDAGRLRLPADLFSIEPRNNDATRVITVDVSAIQGTTTLFVNHSSTAFVHDQRTLLAVFLAAACSSISCPASETCSTGGQCEPIRRPTLPFYDGGVTAPTDIATIDAADAMDVIDIRVAPDTVPVTCNHDMHCDPGEVACTCDSDCPASANDSCCTRNETRCSDPVCPVVNNDGCCTAGSETQCNEGACPVASHDNCCTAGVENNCSESACPAANGDGCCAPGLNHCADTDCPIVNGDNCCSVDGATPETPCTEPVCAGSCGDRCCSAAHGERCSTCSADCGGAACLCFIRCCDGTLVPPGGVAVDSPDACIALGHTNMYCGSAGSERAEYGGSCVWHRDIACGCCSSGTCPSGSRWCAVGAVCPSL